MMELVLTDEALRDRLVVEASEHVGRFDWADLAARTAEVYAELGRAARRSKPSAATRPTTGRVASLRSNSGGV